MPIGEVAAESVQSGAPDVWTSYRTRERLLLGAGCVASYCIFSAIARLFSIPRFAGYEGSLMVQPSPIFALLLAGVVLLGCVVLTSLFAGLVEFEGGLFCATFGLMAMSTRSGPMRYVLMYSPGDGMEAFARAAAELAARGRPAMADVIAMAGAHGIEMTRSVPRG